MMKKFWSSRIKNSVPYVPGEQPKDKILIKLNTNECPYPPAPGIEKELQQYDVEMLRRYPDPNCQMLVDSLAQEYNLAPENVFVLLFPLL